MIAKYGKIAQAFGFRTAWVNRANAPEEYEAPAGAVLADLSALRQTTDDGRQTPDR